MLPYSKIYRLATLCDCGSKSAAASRCCFGGLGLRRRPLALGLLNVQLQAPCARGLADGYGCKAHPHRAMALVSWSRVWTALIDDLGCTGTHEALSSR
jgi:hypothetical protein